MNKHRVDALFFVLDGTLLDTAPDLTTALNQVLLQHNRPTIPPDVVRPQVALGSKGILQCGFTMDEDDPEFEKIRREFLNAYEAHLTDETYLFDGMSTVLDYLDEEIGRA